MALPIETIKKNMRYKEIGVKKFHTGEQEKRVFNQLLKLKIKLRIMIISTFLADFQLI